MINQNSLMFEIKEYYNLIISNHFLKSISLVLLSVFIAKIIDIIFTLIFKKVVKKTETRLDDRILQLLHKPIFYSILFVGFIFAIKTALEAFANVTSVSVTIPISAKIIFGFTSSCLI